MLGTFSVLVDDGKRGNRGNRGSWGKREIWVTQESGEMGVIGGTAVTGAVGGKSE